MVTADDLAEHAQPQQLPHGRRTAWSDKGHVQSVAPVMRCLTTRNYARASHHVKTKGTQHVRMQVPFCGAGFTGTSSAVRR
jgi:hypothetical protein